MAERSDLQENRLKSVENAIAQIQRQYGRGAIMRLGTNERENIPVISTSVLSLDIALGVGGLPRGRVTEIYGPETKNGRFSFISISVRSLPKSRILHAVR